MAEDSKKISQDNPAQGLEGCSSLEKQSADLKGIDAAAAYKPLTSLSPSIGSGYVTQITDCLTQISGFLDQIAKTAANYFKKEDDLDVPSTTAPSGGRYPPGGGGGPRTTTPDTTPSTVPSTNPDSDGKYNLKALEEISLTDLFGLTGQLIKLSDPSGGATLDEYLKDDKNADAIKKLILNSPYVPDSIKAQFKDMDSKVVKQAIYDMITGKNPGIYELNNLNKVALYKYLETVASNNGKTVNQLLSDSKLLRDTMSNLGDVVELVKGWEEQPTETFQEQLKSFYYGDVSKEFPDQDIYATRAYVDYLSTECEVGYDELLNDKEYASTLKKGVQEFGKSLSFFTSTSFFSDKTMTSTIKSAIKDIKIKESAPTPEVTVNNTSSSTGDGGMQNMYVEGGNSDTTTTDTTTSYENEYSTGDSTDVSDTSVE